MSSVSVIIPTYNRADKLDYSVKSVLDQTYGDFKLIIVDDCSKDNTKEVVKDFGDDRIIYHRLEVNKGAAGARNEGVRLADTEFIAFHDSDDKWLPDKLEKQISYIEAHPEVGMVYGRVRVNDPERTFVFPGKDMEGDLEGDLYPFLLQRNTIDTPTMFIRRDNFLDVGGFDESLRCIEDWEFVIRFSNKYKIGFIDDVLIDSYVSANGVSRNIGAYYKTRCKMIAMHKENLIQLGLFDSVVMDVFFRAESSGVLPQVQQIMMSTLSGN